MSPQHSSIYLAVHRMMVFTHAGLACAILVGGPSRFPPPTYAPLLKFFDGAVWPLGVLIGISALLMASHRFWIDLLGLLIGIFWMCMVSAMFVVALRDPHSGSTAFVAYTGLLGINLSLLYEQTGERIELWKARRA